MATSIKMHARTTTVEGGLEAAHTARGTLMGGPLCRRPLLLFVSPYPVSEPVHDMSTQMLLRLFQRRECAGPRVSPTR
jgi:hypothetical protein